MARSPARRSAEAVTAAPSPAPASETCPPAAMAASNARSGDHRPEYVVVARRYRPQTFDELIGQEHVAKALKGAIETGRVGHAYLFTGARGVGKTSAARILAKALDCIHGPAPTPCNVCDICTSIAAGSDVDVLEIDGASNRGIDEIRQLRQNVNIRPSRARYKIYIIDEVHMLTREAFNALLKTLEEPPEHVKFIFCTTEASKIPVTILSRCQRFDFAGIRAPSIAERLRQIAAAEGVEAEEEALAMLARRAGGSMRDSQSLFEQLLSSGQKRITVADLNALLGTAGESRVADLVGAIGDRNAGAALDQLDAAVAEGADVGLLLEQLLGYLRDAMAAAAGCGSDNFLYSSRDGQQRVVEAGQRLGLETILAMIEIVEEGLARLRYSSQVRTIVEAAIVRLCRLEDLTQLAQVIEELKNGGMGAVTGGAASGALRPAAAPPALPSAAAPVTTPPASPAKKKGDAVVAHSPVAQPPVQDGAGNDREVSPADGSEPSIAAAASPSPILFGTDDESARAIWQHAIGQLSGLLPEMAAKAERLRFDGSDRLAVEFPAHYNFLGRPEHVAELEQAVRTVTGRPIKVELRSAAPPASEPAERFSPAAAQRKRLSETSDHPVVRRACELFQAHVTRVEDANN